MGEAARRWRLHAAAPPVSASRRGMPATTASTVLASRPWTCPPAAQAERENSILIRSERYREG